MAAEFLKYGENYLRQDDTGNLNIVSDPETLRGLKLGQLPYRSEGINKPLTFAKTATSTPVSTPTTDDFKSQWSKLMSSALSNYQGVTNSAQLEEKRQGLLRQKMLSPVGKYAPEGDVSSLGAGGALSALKGAGSEYDPAIDELQLQISTAKKGDAESLNNLIKLMSLGKDFGMFGGEEQYQSQIGKEYSDYVTDEKKRGNTKVMSLNEYANMDANRKAKAQSSGLTNSQFAKVTSIAQSYDKHQIVTNYNDVQNKAQSIKQIVDQGIGGPADLALVFEFMKSLDPTSVVRESEYKSAASSGNPFKAIAAKMGGYVSKGQFLPQDVKNEFSRLSNIKLGVIQTQYENYYSEQARKINKITGLNDGTDYLTNFGAVKFGASVDNSRITIMNPDGKKGTIPASQLEQAISQGYKQIK